MRNVALGVFLLALPMALWASESSDWQLFKRVTDAGRQQSFSGTYIHQMNKVLETFRIVRQGGGAAVQERRVALDGLPREILRQGEVLTCYAPDKKSLMAAKISAMRLFPALMSDDIADIAQSYTIRRLDVDRVARRDCEWLEIKARDQSRYTERICADLSTHLPLKMLTLTPGNDMVEQYAFTEVDIGAQKDRAHFKPHYKLGSTLRAAGSKTESAAALSARGPGVTGLPAGFRLVRAVQRPLQVGSGAQPVAHMVFSDGLVMLSLFIEHTPTDLPTSARKVREMNLHGAINMASNNQGEQTLTLVGDMPGMTLANLVGSIRVLARP